MYNCFLRLKRGVGSVFFAEFDTSGSADGGPARRLVLATTQNVIAVLNTKDGGEEEVALPSAKSLLPILFLKN